MSCTPEPQQRAQYEACSATVAGWLYRGPAARGFFMWICEFFVYVDRGDVCISGQMEERAEVRLQPVLTPLQRSTLAQVKLFFHMFILVVKLTNKLVQIIHWSGSCLKNENCTRPKCTFLKIQTSTHPFHLTGLSANALSTIASATCNYLDKMKVFRQQ